LKGVSVPEEHLCRGLAARTAESDGTPRCSTGVGHARTLASKLCSLAGIKARLDIETGEEEPWDLKDLRKTCATYYDEYVPESSVEILGHSIGGITYRH